MCCRTAVLCRFELLHQLSTRSEFLSTLRPATSETHLRCRDWGGPDRVDIRSRPIEVIINDGYAASYTLFLFFETHSGTTTIYSSAANARTTAALWIYSLRGHTQTVVTYCVV